MYDADATSSRLAVAELSKPGVTKRLLKFAMWSTPSEAEAEDLIANTLLRVLDPQDAPWDPARGSFLKHMAYVMRQQWDRHVRKSMVQKEIVGTGLASDEHTVSREPPADDELDRRRSLAVLRTLGERLLVRVGDDVRARQVFDLGAQGIHEQSEQAEVLACTSNEVKDAVLRLKYHARLVREEWTDSEERRMTALRENATQKAQEGSS
jgi:DNA-directed RNA polymerase specialized sigma24 family protein